jgi:hypothetical protein
VEVLRSALEGADQVFTTGLVLQELLQGFAGPKARSQLIESFAALAFLQPDRGDHIEAAEIRDTCRRSGVQIGTIDAVLMQLCLSATRSGAAQRRQGLSRCLEARQVPPVERWGLNPGSS